MEKEKRTFHAAFLISVKKTNNGKNVALSKFNSSQGGVTAFFDQLKFVREVACLFCFSSLLCHLEKNKQNQLRHFLTAARQAICGASSPKKTI